MSDNDYANEVKCTFEKFKGLCDESTQIHVTLLGLLPEDEATKHDTWYKAKMLNVNDFIADVGKWLRKTQSSPADDDVTDDVTSDNHDKEDVQVEPHDSISNVESKIGSKRSSHKGSKSSISSSSTSSARIKAEADKAALMARAAALKEKHALEEQGESLRRKKEQLELDTEIAASSARLAILQGSHSSVSEGRSDGMESYFRKESTNKNISNLLNPYGKIDEHWYEQPSQQYTSPHKVQSNIQSEVERVIASDCYSQQEANYAGGHSNRPTYSTRRSHIRRSLPCATKTE